ncbi:hypothetical protein HK096_000711 [Nowakowskiella sp. JEL0078]|nr:hypothetical protein HK096_000711 [Nowakowskiella sp. JEL0078]
MDTTEAGTAMHILARAAEHHSAIPSSLFRHRPLRIWTDNGYRARKPFKRRKEFKVEVGESRRGTATTHGVEVYRMTKRRVSPIKMDPRKRVVVGVDCDGKKLEDVVSKDWLGTHNPPINWHSLELPLTKLADVSENVRVGESNDDGDGDVLDRGQAARLIGLLDRWCRDEIEKKRKD